VSRIAAIVALIAAVAGCPGSKAKPVESTSSSPTIAPPSAELVRQLESAALESLSQLSLGNLDAYAEGMRADRPVVLLGAQTGDTFIGDARGSSDIDRRPLADLYPQLLSKNLDIQVSTTGAVGWVFDEISYRIPVEGRWASVPIRVTAVFTRDVDRWVLAMDHWSYARSTSDIAGAGVTVDALAGDREGSGTKALVSLVGRLENGDKRARALGRSTAERALLLLPGPDAEFHGDQITAAPTLPELFGQKGTVGLRQHRVEVAPTGDVAWMATNLVLSGSDLELLLRATYVFVHGERGWQVVQEHISAPVPEGFFDDLLFGEPEKLPGVEPELTRE
jgi:ketosteroid isomerase-like protein